MIEFRQSETFRRWRIRLKDQRIRALVTSRLDVKPVGSGISELRIDYGPGYRIYYKRHGDTIILLLCGGDKRTQANDIETAKRLAKEWSEKGD
jgi:putative addiction module killer protein